MESDRWRVKAESKTTTRVTVTILLRELVEIAQAKGIHIPSDAAIGVYPAPFDDEFAVGEQGVVLEWQVDHAQKQG